MSIYIASKRSRHHIIARPVNVTPCVPLRWPVSWYTPGPGQDSSHVLRNTSPHLTGPLSALLPPSTAGTGTREKGNKYILCNHY